MEFGRWHPLQRAVLDEAPVEPGALQLRREAGLIEYPTGKSAMVFYAFAQSGVRAALERAFADELAAPGARGQGPLLVRWSTEAGAEEALAALLDGFVARFGALPALHVERG